MQFVLLPVRAVRYESRCPRTEHVHGPHKFLGRLLNRCEVPKVELQEDGFPTGLILQVLYRRFRFFPASNSHVHFGIMHQERL